MKQTAIPEHKTNVVDEIKQLYQPSVYRLIHLTAYKITELHKKDNWEAFEPRGLHYAIEFVRFYEDDYKSDRLMYGLVMKNKNIYTNIDKPDTNKILILRTKKDVDIFKSMYLSKTGNSTSGPLWKWDEFVKHFGGIEWRGKTADEFEYKWPGYGCITNPKIVKQVFLIASRKHGVKQWSINSITEV